MCLKMSVFKCAECSSCRIVCGEVFDELDRMMDVKLKIVHILHLHFSLLMVSIYQTIDSNAMHYINAFCFAESDTRNLSE